MTDIAIFLMDLGGGGAERVMINLAQGFVDHQLSVDLVLVQAKGPYLSQLPAGVNVVTLNSSRLLLSIPKLIQYLKKKQPKFLLSALDDTNFIAILAGKIAGNSTKVAVTVHNNLSQESQNAPQLKRRLTPTFVGWFYPSADYVIGVSNGVTDNLITLGSPPEKTHFIYNPIVSAELLEKLQESVNHPWFASGQPPVILGVGRLSPQKDFATLIRAFAQVRKQHQARLIILGEGSKLDYLKGLVQDFDLTEDVAFPGFVDNPYSYMARAGVLVLSSAWEGFGNVLVEAMAAGTPVVSTDCESGPAEILAQGKYGKLVPVADSQAMAEAILATLTEPTNPEPLKQRAMEFSLENSVNQYLRILRMD
ncbi:Glycosyl transferase, group 1 [Planktothrix serta PCC 8927]|uniref:Glycosyl transferase, group 1 n=1 Tax=Planktothrix serta PCC 8927 TaxID=671068 RepID=A0A7Z9DXI9_9CYAN|nr:glycosyltransferase [Planktothrix serta]VXD11301.1 Glycosyl transferase, group 1 [Planktothrix serta PCC 8927]